jgi:hypothetical protein
MRNKQGPGTHTPRKPTATRAQQPQARPSFPLMPAAHFALNKGHPGPKTQNLAWLTRSETGGMTQKGARGLVKCQGVMGGP